MKNELYTLSQDSNKQWAAELNIKNSRIQNSFISLRHAGASCSTLDTMT